MAKIIQTDEDGQRVVYDADANYVVIDSPFARLIWTLLGILNALLALRFILRMFGANPSAAFTDFVYTITRPLVAPFVGVIRSTLVSPGTIEWSTILGMVVYWLLAWAIARLATIDRPVAKY